MPLGGAVKLLLEIDWSLTAEDPAALRARGLLEALANAQEQAQRRKLVGELVMLLVEIDPSRRLLQPVLRELATPETVPLAAFEVRASFPDWPELREAPEEEPFDTSLHLFTSRRRRPLPLKVMQVEAGERSEGGEAMIERTPHIDIEGSLPIPVGSTFRVEVYLNAEDFNQGESGAKLQLPRLEGMLIGVALTTSDHFAVCGDTNAEITLSASQPRSSSAVFTLECLGYAETSPGIAASFQYGWRAVGHVCRGLEIESEPEPSSKDRHPPSGGAMAIDPAAQAPDLEVRVMESADLDERHYEVTITSKHLPDAMNVTVPWSLPSATKQYVEGFMSAFTTVEPAGRRSALVGAGKDLYRATPKAFKDAFWKLSDRGMLRTISIVTAEPFIPWELMVPNRDGSSRPPIGVEFVLGRWVQEDGVSSTQLVPLTDSYVVAPKYRGQRKLEFSKAEAQLVLECCPGESITPAWIATIDAKLATGGASLLHFVGHGSEGPSGQIFELDPDERLLEIQIEGMDGLESAVRARRPLVFINACDGGRGAPALVGTGGFAARFARLGARCVIAPIWSVKDSVAENVARTFYERVKAEPDTPFAEILRDIRGLGYDAKKPEDSYAAYCFYGDPLAAQSPPPEKEASRG
ncbi:MAG TPA: CHAT domain-containing protein [Solirubrobacteraceae bacterium]